MDIEHLLTSIGSFITASLPNIISFPTVALIIIIFWRKNITCLMGEIEKKLKQGTVHSLSISGINIEFSEAEFNNPGIIESISLDSNEDLDFLRKRKKVLKIDLSKKQTTANLYYSIKHLYKFKGLKLLVFTIENEMFLRTMEVEEFLAEFEQQNLTYLQAYEQAYAKILVGLANVTEEKLKESSLYREQNQSHCDEDMNQSHCNGDILLPRKSFHKYKEILENLGKNSTEEFTSKNLQDISKNSKEKIPTQTLHLKEETCKECLSAKDLLEALNFNSDFIPVTEQGQYRGVVEKSYIVQLIIENLLKGDNEK